jgi:hypothetical protein
MKQKRGYKYTKNKPFCKEKKTRRQEKRSCHGMTLPFNNIVMQGHATAYPCTIK